MDTLVMVQREKGLSWNSVVSTLVYLGGKIGEDELLYYP